MKLEFSNQLNVDEETKNLAIQRVTAALDRFASQIEMLAIVGRDQNGPRGGIDKSCRITAHLNWGEAVTVSQQGEEFLKTATEAADRLAIAVGRCLDRMNSRRNLKSFSGT